MKEIPQPDFQPDLPSEVRSYADDDDQHTHHFKGDPKYVLRDDGHGKRFHLAHPAPEKVKEHLKEVAEEGEEMHIFGYQNQAWDGSRFGKLSQVDSAGFAEITGCKNAEEWVKRLTAGIPFEGGVHAEFSIGSNDSYRPDYEHQYIVDDAESEGWEVNSGYNGDEMYRTKYVKDDEGYEDEVTEYYNYSTQEWQTEETKGIQSTPAPVYLTTIKHPQLGRMVRGIYEDPYEGLRVADQTSWEAPASMQGKGHSSFIYQSQFEAYASAGVDLVRVHANISVGGYAWARHGFEADNYDSFYDAQTDAKNNLEDKMDRHGFLDGMVPAAYDEESTLTDFALKTAKKGDIDPAKMSQDEYVAQGSSDTVLLRDPDLRVAIHDHVKHGNEDDESIARHTLGLVGAKPEDFEDGATLTQFLDKQKKIGGTEEQWQDYEDKSQLDLLRSRHRVKMGAAADIPGSFESSLDDMAYLHNIPDDRLERLKALAKESGEEFRPVQPGRLSLPPAEKYSVYQGWKGITGWQPENHKVTQQYQAVRQALEDAEDMPQLASVEYPKELAKALGEIPGDSVAKQTMLSSDWHGRQEIGYRSGVDENGNKYRAGKLMKKIQSADGGGDGEPSSGIIQPSGKDEKGGRSLIGGTSIVTLQDDPLRAWNTLVGNGNMQPHEFASIVEAADHIHHRIDNADVMIESPRVVQNALDHFRFKRDRSTPNIEGSPRHHPDTWRDFMDDAPMLQFETPRQIRQHAHYVAHRRGNPEEARQKTHKLYDHWDLATHQAHTRDESYAPTSRITATDMRVLEGPLKGTGVQSRLEAPDDLSDFLRELHHADPNMLPVNIQDALKFWYSGQYTGDKRRQQINFPALTQVYIGNSDFADDGSDIENLRERIKERFGAVRSPDALEQAHEILRAVRKGK